MDDYPFRTSSRLALNTKSSCNHWQAALANELPFFKNAKPHKNLRKMLAMFVKAAILSPL